MYFAFEPRKKTRSNDCKWSDCKTLQRLVAHVQNGEWERERESERGRGRERAGVGERERERERGPVVEETMLGERSGPLMGHGNLIHTTGVPR